MKRAKEDRILRLYTTPGHPTAFSGVTNVARFHRISQDKARELLDRLSTYQLHREFKRPRHFNAYYVRRRRELMQGDLIDVAALKRNNKGVTFLLVLIDVFTKFLWVYPLKNKSGPTVAGALDEWLRTTGKISKFSSDSGLEFYNKHVRAIFAKYVVYQARATGTCKAAVIERANRTLQGILYRYMTNNDTRTYLDVLDKCVKSYNGRGHRSLDGMTPKEADAVKNEEKVMRIHDRRYRSIPKGKVRFKVGDIVRVKIESKALSSSKRSYNRQFNPEFYYVRTVNDTLPVPLYYLRATEDDEDIQGGFYAEELTRVGGDVFLIERIVRKRKRGKKSEVLVKWQGFSDNWNSWEPESSVKKI